LSWILLIATSLVSSTSVAYIVSLTLLANTLASEFFRWSIL
jgi:hypothetical protein